MAQYSDNSTGEPLLSQIGDAVEASVFQMDGQTKSVFLTTSSSSLAQINHGFSAWSQLGHGNSCAGTNYGMVADGCVDVNAQFAPNYIVCVQQAYMNPK